MKTFEKRLEEVRSNYVDNKTKEENLLKSVVKELGEDNKFVFDRNIYDNNNLPCLSVILNDDICDNFTVTEVKVNEDDELEMVGFDNLQCDDDETYTVYANDATYGQLLFIIEAIINENN